MLYDCNEIKLSIDFPLTEIIQPEGVQRVFWILNRAQFYLNFVAVYVSSTIVIAVGRQMASLSIGRLHDHPIEGGCVITLLKTTPSAS